MPKQRFIAPFPIAYRIPFLYIYFQYVQERQAIEIKAETGGAGTWDLGLGTGNGGHIIGGSGELCNYFSYGQTYSALLRVIAIVLPGNAHFIVFCVVMPKNNNKICQNKKK